MSVVKVKTKKTKGNQSGYKLVNEADLTDADELFVEPQVKPAKPETTKPGT